MFVSNSRSRGLRIRSSCINVSEKASKICFAVIGHTSPFILRNRFNSIWAKGEATFAEKPTINARIFQTEFYSVRKRTVGEGRRLFAAHCAGHCPDHGMENFHSIGAAEFGLGRSFGMRHHANYVTAWAANSGNIVERTVRIRRRRNLTFRGGVAEHDAILSTQAIQGVLIAEIVSFHMSDGDRQYFPWRTCI